MNNMAKKDPKVIKREIDKLKREYKKFEVKIQQFKHEQNKIIKKITDKAEKEEIKKIQKLLK